MRAVTVIGLARMVIEWLDLRPGEPFDIAKTRDGHVLLAKKQDEPPNLVNSSLRGGCDSE